MSQTKEKADKIADKISKLRIFEDDNDKMNLSIQGVAGELLVVSQFTLAGNCSKGTRPSFDNAEVPNNQKISSWFVPADTASHGEATNK